MQGSGVQIKRQKTKNPAKQVLWPACIWKDLLSNKCAGKGHLGVGHQGNIWEHAPMTWRMWWINSVINKIPHLSDVTLDNPKPLIHDMTKEFEFVNRPMAKRMH